MITLHNDSTDILITKFGANTIYSYPPFVVLEGELPLGPGSPNYVVANPTIQNSTDSPEGDIFIYCPYNNFRVKYVINGEQVTYRDYGSGFAFINGPILSEYDLADVYIEDAPMNPYYSYRAYMISCVEGNCNIVREMGINSFAKIENPGLETFYDSRNNKYFQVFEEIPYSSQYITVNINPEDGITDCYDICQYYNAQKYQCVNGSLTPIGDTIQIQGTYPLSVYNVYYFDFTNDCYYYLISKTSWTEGTILVNLNPTLYFNEEQIVCPPAPTGTLTPTPTVTPTSTPASTPSSTPTPTPSSTSSPAFTPANLSNLWDWWEAGTGQTLTGSDVDSWQGYNGNILIPFNASYKSTYNSSDSDFNNQPSILVNPSSQPFDVGYTCPNTGGTSDKTVILVGKVNNALASSDNIIYNVGAIGLSAGYLTSTSNQFACLFYNSPSVVFDYVGNQYVTGNYMFLRSSYNYTTGSMDWYQSTSNTFTNLLHHADVAASVPLNTGTINLGNYYGAYGTTSSMKVVEFIVINGIPSGSELSNLSTYITNKYNL